MKTYFHGEVIIQKVDSLPERIKKVRLFMDGCYRLADSETSGNYHLLEAKEGVELFEDSSGVLWLKNDVPTDVYCAVKERHDSITLDPGIWEIDCAQEYDHLADMTRKVAD